MGVQLFPVFDKKVHRSIDTDGKTLARAFPEDENAPLWPLARFYSTSREEVEMLMEEFEAAEMELPEVETQWFDPLEAVEAIESVLQRAASDSEFLIFPAQARIRDANDVIEELQLLREQLLAAAQQGARFHLQFCL